MKRSSSVSVAQLIEAIEALPEDKLNARTGAWYLTQKEHWLGWLRQYGAPGVYGKTQRVRDAKFAYNHVFNPYMLLWLARAAGVGADLIEAAQRAVVPESTPIQKSGAIRRHVRWAEVAEALWPGDEARRLG